MIAARKVNGGRLTAEERRAQEAAAAASMRAIAEASGKAGSPGRPQIDRAIGGTRKCLALIRRAKARMTRDGRLPPDDLVETMR